MRKWLVERPEDNVVVTIAQNVSDGSYSFVNLTHCHICSCRFAGIDEAIHDMDEKIRDGSVIRYTEF